VSPRRGDVELLIELGLGIDRRLRQQGQAGQRQIVPEQVSFWYLANRLGTRFVRDAERKLGPLEALGPGLWRCRLLRRLVLLVSSVDLPVEEDTLPLHIVGIEPLVIERQVAQLIAEHPALQRLYGGWVASLHSTAWKEVEAMARSAGKRLKFDIRPAIESLGWDEVLQQVGIDCVVEQVGVERMIEKLGIERMIKQLGEKEVIKHIGLGRILANLSLAERRELKRRLQ
jgi:hypothetical protein